MEADVKAEMKPQMKQPLQTKPDTITPLQTAVGPPVREHWEPCTVTVKGFSLEVKEVAPLSRVRFIN